MNLADAIEKAQLVLVTYDDCVYDKHAWAAIVRALLPAAVMAMHLHEFIHPAECDAATPIDVTSLDRQQLHKLLGTLCAATKVR